MSPMLNSIQNVYVSVESHRKKPVNTPNCFVMPGECQESDWGSSSLQDQVKTEVLRVLPVVVTTIVKQTEVFADHTYASVCKES